MREDKSEWGPGPWQNEPDQTEWIDEETGYACEIVRNGSGALCGYVAIPETHPYFGRDYNDLYSINVHGGLTYSSPEQKKSDIEKLCEPEDTQPRTQQFGFDCSHSGDLSPGIPKQWRFESSHGCTYRTLNYVKGQCRMLAQQLKKLE